MSYSLTNFRLFSLPPFHEVLPVCPNGHVGALSELLSDGEVGVFPAPPLDGGNAFAEEGGYLLPTP